MPRHDGEFEHLRALPDGTLTQAEVCILLDRLREAERRADEASLRAIEASNPGIDIEKVRAHYFGSQDASDG